MKKADMIEYFGSQTSLARAVGRTQARISAMTDPVPFDIQVLAARRSHYALLPDRETQRRLARYALTWEALQRKGVGRRVRRVRIGTGGKPTE